MVLQGFIIRKAHNNRAIAERAQNITAVRLSIGQRAILPGLPTIRAELGGYTTFSSSKFRNGGRQEEDGLARAVQAQMQARVWSRPDQGPMRARVIAAPQVEDGASASAAASRKGNCQAARGSSPSRG